MLPLVKEIELPPLPESLVDSLQGSPGVMMLRSQQFDFRESRFTIIAACPVLTFRSFGSRCEIYSDDSTRKTFGNPWAVLDGLMDRFELPDEPDCPFPIGGAFGYWGYDLKCFVEARAITRSVNDLELPDCHVGFYDSLIVIDHREQKAWIVSTGQIHDGSRCHLRQKDQFDFWEQAIAASSDSEDRHPRASTTNGLPPAFSSSLDKASYVKAVEKAQEYIRQGHIYQVNLSRRITTPLPVPSWDVYRLLSEISPAPFSSFLDLGDFQILSTSPEQFLQLSGRHIRTRPIKGTRPRSMDQTRDAQLAFELQTSEKERAELLMITDLLRNDLGRICEFGSVQVPELMKLEKFSHVHHLVSTVEGILTKSLSHFQAFARCFPGGSITGAPKIRAMQIIDELEPVSRGPYTGSIGYIGFNRESQLNIAIRSAITHQGEIHYHAGSGIVADSIPEAEFEETEQKAAAFFQTMERLLSHSYSS